MSLIQTVEYHSEAEMLAAAKARRARFDAFREPLRSFLLEKLPAVDPAPKVFKLPPVEDPWVAAWLATAPPPAPPEPRRPSIVEIQIAVAGHFRIARHDLLEHLRTIKLVMPRQIAMYLAQTLTLRSLPDIGRRFNGRHHTTVLHSVRKITGLYANDPQIRGDVDAITARLNAPQPQQEKADVATEG